MMALVLCSVYLSRLVVTSTIAELTGVRSLIAGDLGLHNLTKVGF